MKTKESTHSLIALSFLFVAIVSVGLIMKNLSTIEASSTGSVDQNPNFIALTAGENRFVATQKIDEDSAIIGINGSLISIKEAKRRGIIESVYLFEGRKILSQDINEIDSDQQFDLLVNNISVFPTIYLGAVK